MDTYPLAFDAQISRSARGHVKEVLTNFGASDKSINAALLITSELATNALQHGQAPVNITIKTDKEQAPGGGNFVTIGFQDSSEHLPVLVPITEPGDTIVLTRGRGLGLCLRLAHQLGWVRTPGGGKCVWVQLKL